jgi:DNA-binding transcriptional MerR regulator
MESRLIKVGELASATGKSIRTLRYYEELGLLRPSRRSEGGFRLYEEDAIGRVRTIERLQSLSVPLARIREFAEAWRDAATGRALEGRVRGLFADELESTRRRLAELRDTESELVRTLEFLKECGACDEAPQRDQCLSCAKGGHVGAAPPAFVDAFLQ